jgi:hypothetical protein
MYHQYNDSNLKSTESNFRNASNGKATSEKFAKVKEDHL